MSDNLGIHRERGTLTRRNDADRSPHPQAPAPTAAAFPVLAAPTVVPVGNLTAEAIARCNLRDVEYVVLEPAGGGMRLRPAGIEDQVKHEQEAGLGHTTYSLGEFLDEFTEEPSNPAPTFDRLAQFKRDYAGLTPRHRQLFRAALRKLVAPLSTGAPGDTMGPLVRELKEHPGFFELRFDTDARAIYTFGRAVRPGQPHVILCRIGTGDALDRSPDICNPNSVPPASASSNAHPIETAIDAVAIGPQASRGGSVDDTPAPSETRIA